MRLPAIGILAVALLSQAPASELPTVDPSEGLPLRGQPAADVLASEDAWGDPTFIGGLTNSGPTAHSVW